MEMSENIPDFKDVFEITDHTTASDWERFTSSLEETLTEFDLANQTDNGRKAKELPIGFVSSGFWYEKHDTIQMWGFNFDIRYQYLDDSKLADENQLVFVQKQHDPDGAYPSRNQNEVFEIADRRFSETAEKDLKIDQLPDELPECLLDLVSTNNDFASKAHCLVRWYNFRKFIIVTPREQTIPQHKINLLLSSCSIVLANIGCHVPILVQQRKPLLHEYQGVSEHLNIRTTYEMMVFRNNTKQQFSYLTPLVGIFREKTGCNLSDLVTVSIRLNYCLDHFEFLCYPLKLPIEFFDEEDHQTTKTATSDKTRPVQAQDMRSGATLVQVKRALVNCTPHSFQILKFIHVAALWPPISDKVVVDQPTHSDLDPAEAPIWTMRSVTRDICNMKIVHETQAINDLFQRTIAYAYDRSDASQVFKDCDRTSLEEECLRISYELATKPEVIVSRSPTDNVHIRKVISLMFYRASKHKACSSLQDQAETINECPSLHELYRNFKNVLPSIKEFIIRTQVPRPFNSVSNHALPQRMFCSLSDQEFRVCGAFSEWCN